MQVTRRTSQIEARQWDGSLAGTLKLIEWINAAIIDDGSIDRVIINFDDDTDTNKLTGLRIKLPEGNWIDIVPDDRIVIERRSNDLVVVDAFGDDDFNAAFVAHFVAHKETAP